MYIAVLEYTNILKKLIILYLSDNSRINGDVCYTTKLSYAIDTGLPGAALREAEERQNSLCACPNKMRSGESTEKGLFQGLFRVN